MNVEAKITVYEVDDEDADDKGCDEEFIIRSHWNRNGTNGFVVMQPPNGPSYTVSAASLQRAIKSCTGLC